MKEVQRKRIKSRSIPSLLLAFFIFISFNATALVSYSATNEAGNKPQDKSSSTANTATKDKGTDKGFLYDPTNKTDPFRSFIAAREEEKKEDKRVRTYLETLELSQLDLIVIVVGKEGRWAMVRDSKGLGHVIKEGTPIGTNYGVVSKIEKGVVTIREEYKDFRGRTQVREIKKETPALR